MKTARIICLAAASCAWAVVPVLAQRVQFATPVAQQPAPAAPGAPATSAPSTPYVQPTPGYVQPTPGYTQPAPTYVQPAPAQPSPTYPPPGAAPAPGAQVVTPPGTIPSTVGQAPVAPGATMPGPSPTFGPVPAPTYGSPPPATFNGTIQPPPAFDPYATPGVTPSPLLPQDPYYQCGPGVSVATMQKFIQHVDFDYHWFAGNPAEDNHELGINDVELSCTFAFPLFHNSQTPLLITPGFAVHYWSGPTSVQPLSPANPAPADLPPQTYDAYLDAAWNPQLTPWFGAELDGRYGVYSDFSRVENDALRFTGKALAVLTFSPCIKIKAGVWYINRNEIKLLPAGGICWTPNPDVYFNILFPNPKIARRLTTSGNTQWWIYVSGDYGGGKWAIKRNDGLPPNPFYPVTNGTFDTFDYNDIRVAVGIEFDTLRQLHGIFEVGGAFDRQLIYQSTLPPAYYPTNTVFVRGGLSY